MSYPEKASAPRDPFFISGNSRPTRAIQLPRTAPARNPRLPLTRPENRNLPDDQHSDASTGGADRNRALLGTIICAISLALGLFALKGSPESKIGPYGLIQALSPWYYLAIGMLVLSFAWSLRTERYHTLLLGAHLTALVILVHGAPGIVESAPRFPSAWVHTGFTNYIAATGKTLPQLDARFSWPSFFAASAMLDKAAGVSTADVFLRWWPVALNLLYLPLIFRIAKEFLRSDIKAWIATGIFPLANWVGQDYYSPQSMAFLLYLTFFYILIGPLGAHDRPSWHLLWRPLNRKYSPEATSPQTPRDFPPTSGGQQNLRAPGFHLVILALLMAAMATSHQLTPIMATVTALVLVLAGRTRVRGMVVVFGLMTAAWVCYGAYTFWSGHMSAIIGGLGAVQSNVGTSVGARVTGSFAHQFVVDVRLLVSLAVWLLTILGALVWRPRNRDRAALAVCFLAPFGTLAAADYGGEAMLRVYLFSLPPAVCLIAVLICKLHWPYRQAALSAALILLLPFFLVARWGNEMFEMVRPNELTAEKVFYQIASPGSTLVTLIPELAPEFDDTNKFKLGTVALGVYNFGSADLSDLGSNDIAKIIQAVSSNPRDSYVIMTTGQAVYGWLNYGMPRTWGTTVEGMLSRSPHFKLRYSNPDAEIFQYIPGRGSK